MQRGLGIQRQEAREAVEEAKRDLEGEFEKFESESESENQEENGTGVISKNGRHVFGTKLSGNKPEEQVDKQKPIKKVFDVKASGPVLVRQDPLFHVDSFEDPNEIKLKTHAPQVKSKPKIDEKRPKAITISSSSLQANEEDNEEANPWLQADATAVKKSIQVSHKQFEKNSKDLKAIAKIASEKKKQLKSDDNGEEEAILETNKIIYSDSEPEDTESVVPHLSDVKDLHSKQVMQMAFVNDLIAKVLSF
jgi:hypothetical protein